MKNGVDITKPRKSKSHDSQELAEEEDMDEEIEEVCCYLSNYNYYIMEFNLVQ